MLARKKEAAIEEFGVVGGNEELPDFRARRRRRFRRELRDGSEPARQVSTSISCSKSAASISARWALSSEAGKEPPHQEGCFRRAKAALGKQPFARNGGGDTDAVARFAVGSDSAAMLEASESAKCMVEDLVRGLGGKLGDEANAARVKIESRVDQAAINIGRQLTRMDPSRADLAGGMDVRRDECRWGKPIFNYTTFGDLMELRALL